jgi:hypothetical protein
MSMEMIASVLNPDVVEVIDDMGTGSTEMLLVCTDGIYKGYFLYLNTTKEGERFGSGDPER